MFFSKGSRRFLTLSLSDSTGHETVNESHNNGIMIYYGMVEQKTEAICIKCAKTARWHNRVSWGLKLLE